MVSVLQYTVDAFNITDEIEQRFNAVDEDSTHYFLQVRIIQRIFRGYLTRKHIELLHGSATCIQKHWRAFVSRIEYEKLLLKKFEKLRRNYYNQMATRIQSHWKGYKVRSRVFNFYKLKGWLNFVSNQNDNLRGFSEKYQAAQNNIEIEQREIEAKQWIIYILFKLHHLLRTHQISGIYSLPKTRNLSDIEKMLTCLKFKDFMTFYNAYKEDVRTNKIKEMPSFILQNCGYPARFEREIYLHKTDHKDPYVDIKVPVDRYTRYELRTPVKCDLKKDTYNIQTCQVVYEAKDLCDLTDVKISLSAIKQTVSTKCECSLCTETEKSY